MANPSDINVFALHPAADVFAIMSDDELRQLAEDINMHSTESLGFNKGYLSRARLVLNYKPLLAREVLSGMKLLAAAYRARQAERTGPTCSTPRAPSSPRSGSAVRTTCCSRPRRRTRETSAATPSTNRQDTGQGGGR